MYSVEKRTGNFPAILRTSANDGTEVTITRLSDAYSVAIGDVFYGDCHYVLVTPIGYGECCVTFFHNVKRRVWTIHAIADDSTAINAFVS